MRIPLFLPIFIAIGLQGAHCEEFRIFKLKTGPIEAELIDATPDEVTLRIKEDKKDRRGSEIRQYVSAFSEPDREFIREWRRTQKGEYDWPARSGPNSDRATEESVVVDAPKVLWRGKVGAGDAAVIVADGRAVSAGVLEGKFQVTALATEGGAQLWQKGYNLKGKVSRAGATPAFDLNNNRVVALGPSGRIDCLELKDGANVWATPLSLVYSKSEPPVGGQFPSPILNGANVILEIGGPAHSLVALSKYNGREEWGIGRHRSLGAVPTIAELQGERVIVSRNAYGFVGRDPETGDMRWDAVWETGGTTSAVKVGEDLVFVTSREKCAVYRINGNLTEQLWENSVLCSASVTPVFYKGHLYGFDAGGFVCVDVKKGKVVWKSAEISAGNLIRAADRLLVQTEKTGEMVIVEASPRAYNEVSRIKVFEGESNTIPVFASGLIFCRSASGDVTCLDARAE